MTQTLAVPTLSQAQIKCHSSCIPSVTHQGLLGISNRAQRWASWINWVKLLGLIYYMQFIKLQSMPILDSNTERQYCTLSNVWRQHDLCFKNTSKGLECFWNANNAEIWNTEFAATDPSTAKFRSGWIVIYGSFLFTWASNLQSLVAISGTEA